MSCCRNEDMQSYSCVIYDTSEDECKAVVWVVSEVKTCKGKTCKVN